MRGFGALCLVLAVVGTGFADEARAAERRALIVSINKYHHPQWKLNGAVNDGRNIERLLKTDLGYKPDQIKELFDGAATRDGILAAFREWLIKGTKSGDEAFFYFSGHGYQQPDGNGDEEDGLDETMVPVDADEDGRGGVKNMIIDDEMDALLNEMRDRKVTLVVDSCHSGTVTRGLFDRVEGARSLPELPGMKPPARLASRSLEVNRAESAMVDAGAGRAVWTAVAPFQVALEETGKDTGVFTNRFISGFLDKKADANHDGVVTNAELFAYVQKESDVYCKSLRACQAGLTPTLEIASVELAAPALGGGGGVQSQMVETAQPVSARPQNAAALQNAGTGILANDNQGGVSLRVLPGGPVKIGKTVRFEATSETEGSLVLLDADAAGNLIQLFPNDRSKERNRSNRIYPGRPITIPDQTYGFEFTAEEPVGRGTLIALVIQDAVDVTQLVEAHRDLTPVAMPVDYMTRIAERLRRPWTQGPTTRMARWSMTSLPYDIVR